MPDPTDRHRRAWIAAVLLFVLIGASLRIVGLDWDQGHLFHPDERNILYAAANLTWEKRLEPDFFAYNGLSFYAPRAIAEVLSLFPGMPAATDLAFLSLVSRWISAIAAILTLLAVTDIGRLIGDARGAAIAAGFCAFDGGLIQAAHFGTTESAMVFLIAVLADLAARLLTHRIALPRFALGSGAALGVGLALKTTALSFAAIPAIAGLFALRMHRLRLLLAWAVAALVLATLLFVALSPWSLINLETFRATMRFEQDVATGATSVFWTLQFFDTPKVLYQIANMALLSGPFLAGLGIAGAIAWLIALSVRHNDLALAPLIAFAALYAAITFGWHAKFVRYLLPLTPALVLAATWFSLSLLAAPGRLARAGGRTLVAIAVLATAVWGTATASVYWKPDSRLVAAEWLKAHVQPGDTIAVEEGDIPPPLPSGHEAIVLPVLKPDGADTDKEMAERISRSDWLVISSRRLSGTLPRHPDHRIACAYYLALARGTIGFDRAAQFERPPTFLGWEIPANVGEETISAFDHPRVTVYRNSGQRTSAAIAEAFLRQDPTACEALAIGADLLDLPPSEAD